MVVASAAISSRVLGTWRPGAGSRAETEATSRRSRSTGDSAARASPYPPSPAAATNTTPAMTSSRVTSLRVRSNASRSTLATATQPGCPASGPALTRSRSSSSDAGHDEPVLAGLAELGPAEQRRGSRVRAAAADPARRIDDLDHVLAGRRAAAPGGGLLCAALAGT